jgi:hypothetical protein
MLDELKNKNYAEKDVSQEKRIYNWGFSLIYH